MKKILMTWELDSDPIHLHHLRLLAHHLRQRFAGVHIALATTQKILTEETLWADEVFITPRMQFKHNHEAKGIIGSLSQLGWTAPDLRQSAFIAWSQLFRAYQPDVVIAESSPGAVLSAILEDIKVIQTSHGPHISSKVDREDDELFPEFQSWLWHVTGRLVSSLMNTASLVFTPPASDVQRCGMVLHASPAECPWLTPIAFDEQALLIGEGDGIEKARLWLAGLGISSRMMGSKPSALTVMPGQLVFGQYDSYSLSVAQQSSYLYMGIKPLEKNVPLADRSDRRKLSIRLAGEDDLAMVLSSLKPAAKGAVESNQLIPVSRALDFMLI